MDLLIAISVGLLAIVVLLIWAGIDHRICLLESRMKYVRHTIDILGCKMEEKGGDANGIK